MAIRNFGRYRRVTDAAIARILAWHDNRMSRRQLARELGLSESTIGYVIKSRGTHYKTESPEVRRLRPTVSGTRRARAESPSTVMR